MKSALDQGKHEMSLKIGRRKWNQFPERSRREERNGLLSKCIKTPSNEIRRKRRVLTKNLSASSRLSQFVLLFSIINYVLIVTDAVIRQESALYGDSSDHLTESSEPSYVFTSPTRNCGKVFGSHLSSEFGHIFASTPTDIPFIVQITLENTVGIIKSKCVGSILTDTWIITSADCGADAFIADSNLSFKVTHFDLDFDHWSSGIKAKKEGKLNVPRETINVTDIHLTSISKTCAPMLLKLQKPISVPITENNVCLPPNIKIRNEWKGISTGWSSYGDSVIERYLRVTQVSVRDRHCLSSMKSESSKIKTNAIKDTKLDDHDEEDDDGDLFCVSYLPQVHFYLLPGSPLLTVHQDVMILMGVACTNLTSKLVNSSYVYSQTYSRVSSYIDLLTVTIDTDGNANQLLLGDSALAVSLTIMSKLLIFLSTLFVTLLYI